MKYFERLGLLGLIVCASARPVFAQTIEERAGARAAAEQGVKAYNEGRWAEAADLMSRAEQLVHAPPHLLYFAQAEEKLGHLVSAHETYLKIMREPLGRDAPSAFVAAQADARQREAALRPRISRVTIVVQGGQAGTPVTVTMDNARVPDALVGVPHPVDPGEHQFEAVGDGMRSGPAKLVLREGTSETVVLRLQSGAAMAAAPTPNGTQPASSAAMTTQPAVTTAPPMADSKASTSTTMKVAAYASLGVGVVGVGLGSYFAIRAKGSRDDADALCTGPNGACPTTSRARIEDLDSTANSSATLSLVSFLTGGVGIAAGVSLLLLAPSSHPPAASAFVAPYVAGNGAGVWGRF